MRDRIKKLIEKLISFKFVMFVIATVLRCFNLISSAEWLSVTLVVIAGREAQKMFGNRM